LPPLEELFAEVRINRQAPEQALVLRQSDGALFARAADLQRWRFRLPDSAALGYRGEDFYPLAAFAGLSYRFDEGRGALIVDASPGLFVPTSMRGSAPRFATPQPAPLGAFANYDLSFARAEDHTSRSGFFELGAFGAAGVGVTSFLAQPQLDPEHTRGVRLESTWTYDRPDKVQSLRFGDTIGVPGAWGRSVRYGGVQWATNFATQPGLITFPLPAVAGEAVVPSTVDLYVNNALQLHREVPSGPFTIQDLPVVTGRGDARVVVRDVLGRERVVLLPYYASPRLLQQGLHDFSYEAGAVRENFGIASADYGRFMSAATHRLGITDSLTAEVRGELLRHQKTGGAGLAWLAPELGVFSAQAAGSSSDSGRGGLVGFGWERQARRLGFGASTQAASEHFTQLGLQPDELAPRQMTQAFASLATEGYGAFGVNYIHRGFRDRADVELISASYSVGVARFAFVSFVVLRTLGVQPQSSANVLLTIPLGTRTTASLTSFVQGQQHQTLAQLQQNLPAGTGFGYRMLASTAGPRREEAGVAYQNAIGTYTLDAGRAQDTTSVRAGASGGVALLDGGLHLARRMDQSFALAEVPGMPGVRVYADNQLVARTGEDGTAFLPRLRPYEVNRISIEQADLPLDAEVGALEQDAVPYYRSGVLVHFPVQRVRGAMLTVVLENGQPIPAGALAQLVGASAEYPVGLNGKVYLTGLAASNQLRVNWRGQSCEFAVSFNSSAEPQPDLGQFICKGVKP
jgi:outer membrane usher protein